MKSTRTDVILAVDIGNSQTAIGFYPLRGKMIRKCVRIPTIASATSDLLLGQLYPHLCDFNPRQVILSSVVPSLSAEWKEFAEIHLRAKFLALKPKMIPVTKIRISRPHEVGIDRLVNTWISHRRYRGPLVVVDMGTATTFDVVSKDGSYLGGVIAPGVKLFPSALAQHTARLPLVGIEPPKKIVGTSTTGALSTGIVIGHASMVEGLLNAIKKETKISRAVATGGLMNSVRPMLGKRFLAFDDTLTLDGIHELGRRRQ